MTSTTAAPRSAAARTRAIKAQLRKAGLPEVMVRVMHGVGGSNHTVFTAGMSADDAELVADILDAIAWVAGPVDRQYLAGSGFVSATVPDTAGR